MSKNRIKLPKIEPTPEAAYWNRRAFIEKLGLGSIAVAGAAVGSGCDSEASSSADSRTGSQPGSGTGSGTASGTGSSQGGSNQAAANNGTTGTGDEKTTSTSDANGTASGTSDANQTSTDTTADSSTSKVASDDPTVDKELLKKLPTSPHPAVKPGLLRATAVKHFPAKRNKKYKLPANAKLTDQVSPSIYNNFYEFTTTKEIVWRLAGDFKVDPWTIEVSGLCNKPRKFGIDDMFKLLGGDQEERTYRFRCVEAWAMDVPWTGFSLSKLLKLVDPKSTAKFVKFHTANRPKEMPGIATQTWYKWPYYEGLRMDEAMNELTMVATGLYGRPLPKQNGAPFRIIVPWKYGYKSPKSIVKIELVSKQPGTFWADLQAQEYPFQSNVEPKVPHPRWSQAQERLIPTGDIRETLLYNGYEKYVAGMYKKG
jgi:methionine sulfoxide reductase catalytic subunit